MKVHSIKHKNFQPVKKYDKIINEAVDSISSARFILLLDKDNTKKDFSLQDVHKKWKINNYGAPVLFSRIKTNTHQPVNLSYTTISSCPVLASDNAEIEYAGLQLGEIENNYFSRLLNYNSEIAATFSFTQNNNSFLKHVYENIVDAYDNMKAAGLTPIFLVGSSFLLNSLLDSNPSFHANKSSFSPFIGSLKIKNNSINVVVNNLTGSDLYYNLYLCANLLGPMHIKGDVQSWEKEDKVIFTEQVGMAIFNEKGIKRFIFAR